MVPPRRRFAWREGQSILSKETLEQGETVKKTEGRENRRRLWRLVPPVAAPVIVAISSVCASAALPPGNPVQQWNRIAEDTVVGAAVVQNEGLIYMAYVSAAAYDAATAIQGGYESYGRRIVATPPGASIEAAVVEAAYTSLRYYCPAQAASLDAWHEDALAVILDGSAKSEGTAVGRLAAQGLIRLRADDGRLSPDSGQPT